MPQMRWDCKTQGCFNLLKRPKIERFDNCFDGQYIAMGDVDGIIERRGKFLMLEWKETTEIPQGQKIMYKTLSDTGLFNIYVATGNARTMDVTQVQRFVRGKLYGPYSWDLEKLKSRFSDWDDWVLGKIK